MREKLFVRTHAKSYLCRTAVLTSAVLCALSSLPVGAHGEEVPNSGFTQAYVSDFERVSKKIMDLAAAMPEETFNWRRDFCHGLVYLPSLPISPSHGFRRARCAVRAATPHMC